MLKKYKKNKNIYYKINIIKKMFCINCNQKLNVKNIVRLCKSSDTHIYCKSCFDDLRCNSPVDQRSYKEVENHQLNKDIINCPSCNSFISKKEEIKEVNEDFANKKDELLAKTFIATYCVLHKNNIV